MQPWTDESWAGKREGSAARRHDARVVREDDGLHAIADAQLHEDASHVRLDGGLGEDQGLDDLGVAEAPAHELEDLLLAWGERREEAGMLGIRSVCRSSR